MNATQVAKVIKAFEKVLKQYPEARLDMGQTMVQNRGYACGTVHCHGGWYAVARVNLLQSACITFKQGADQLAQDLGFENRHALARWAKSNPEIWGPDGLYMFGNRFAFTPGDKDRALNLQDIIDHWYEVHDRLWLSEQL